MFRRLIIPVFLFILLGIAVSAPAQILPREGSSINYRIIGFSFPPAKFPKGTNCKIEIANGTHNELSSFKNNIIHVEYLHSNKVIIEVPAFGKAYTWRVEFSDKAYAAQNNKLHHFYTAAIPNIDTGYIRLRVLKKTLKYKDCFVLLDGSKVMYNMKGEPVWFAPKNVIYDSSVQVTDLKTSYFGTITMLVNNDALEIGYDGNLIWNAPHPGFSSDTNKYYHHQLDHLQNGHYMVLALKKSDYVNSSLIASASQGNSPPLIEDDIIMEYDAGGKLIWSLNVSELYNGKRDKYINNVANVYLDPHANAFAFDEKKGYIYVSFKNTSQVLKIKYPETTVVGVFGIDDIMNANDVGSPLFCMQHACKISPKGYLYLFNNNVYEQITIPPSQELSESGIGKPRISVFEEDKMSAFKLNKIWDFECPVVNDTFTYDIRQRILRKKHTVGGNVIELNDGSIFTSLCSPYSNLFIVSRSKKLMWEAVAEIRNKNSRKWMPLPSYRASIIRNRKELENIIWNTYK